MKPKLLLLPVFLLLFFSLSSQTFFQDDFSDGLSQWSATGDFPHKWAVSPSNFAGGEIPELQYTGTGSIHAPGKSVRLATKKIDLSAYPDMPVYIYFNQTAYLSGALEMKVETSSDGGKTWNTVWEQDNHQSPLIKCQNSDIGSADFQFSFFLAGNFKEIYYWAIDDVALFGEADYDAYMQSVTCSPTWIDLTKSISVEIAFLNSGMKNITDLEMWYQVDDLEPVMEIQTGLFLPSFISSSAAFQEEISGVSEGTHTVKAWISRVNGVPISPKYVTTQIEVIDITPPIVVKAMVESFTSSTCMPCPQTNAWLNPLLAANAYRCAVTKYQMNWPSGGDPYYTEEGGVRKSYYKVSAVPEIFVGGIYTERHQSDVKSRLDSICAMPGMADIRSTFEMAGSVVKVKLYITPFITGNRTVYVSVNEKLTHGNESVNGEKDFYHVMMKMLPDAHGTKVDLEKGKTIALNFEHDMSDTFVEELDDLEVSVWLQDDQTKEIYNAANAIETSQSIAPPLNLTIQVEGHNVALHWDAPAPADGLTGYNLYRNGERIAENLQPTTFTDEETLYGYYIYAVTACYSDMESTFTSKNVSLEMTPPKNLAVTTTDYKTFELTWEYAEKSPKGYDIYRQGTKINTAPVSTTSYTDTAPYEGLYCYTVKGVDDYGTSAHSEKGCVYVNPPQNVTAQQVELESREIEIRWDAVEGVTVDGYNVYRNGVKINGFLLSGTSFREIVDQGGEYCYTVTVQVFATESEKSNETCVLIPEAIDDGKDMANMITLYPNPARDEIYIDTEIDFNAIQVFDLQGKEVYSSYHGNKVVSLTDWAPGIYIMNITTEKGRVNKLFIKN